jgi:hypothetical protein
MPSHLAKLRRAQTHLALLHKLEESLRDGEVYRTFTECAPETGEVIVYGEPRRGSPTAEWGVVIGDIVHNLRSALDHLVWALTLAYQPGPPPNSVPRKGPGSEWKDVAFPIYTDPYPLDASGNLIPWRNAKEPKSLWGIDPVLRADFEELQPFKRKGNPALVQLGTDNPAFDPLAILHNLWNIDKHRHVNLAVFIVGFKDLFEPLLFIRYRKGSTA